MARRSAFTVTPSEARAPRNGVLPAMTKTARAQNRFFMFCVAPSLAVLAVITLQKAGILPDDFGGAVSGYMLKSRVHVDNRHVLLPNIH